MKLLRISSVSLFFVSLLFMALACVPVRAVPSHKFVSLSLMLEATVSEDQYSRLSDFLVGLDYHNFSFVVVWVSGVPDFWLDNVTRRDLLKAYGQIIPRLPYPQVFSLADRIYQADYIMGWWAYHVGYYPKGWFDFNPDTFTMEYLYGKYGITYVQGSCFDQYLMDYMSMRGGWQLPYYASSANLLVPSYERGLVVFPHVTWDWSASFEVGHEWNLHPINAYGNFATSAEGDAYYRKFVQENSVACLPFSVSFCQCEWNWLSSWGLDDEVFSIWQYLLENTSEGYEFIDFETLAQWFLDSYNGTPDYSVSFMSPYNGRVAEWFFSPVFRASRVDGKVNSYVQYQHQANDPYLDGTVQGINWGLSGTPCAVDNQVDTSLNFTIDAFGGGNYRAPVVDSPVRYAGGLAEFPLHYRGGEVGSQIVYIVLPFAVFSVVVGILVIRRRM